MSERASRREEATPATFDAERIAELLRDDAIAGIAEIRAAARRGVIEAQALLGQIFVEGRYVDADANEGLHWYVLAANSGDAAAMNMVGRCHELGRGTPANASLAAAWYRKAADAGLDWGLYNYAQLLASGRGVKPDRAKALALYRRAAAMGHAKSMNMLGRHYDEGWDVEADRAMAILWYRAAAEGGDFRGQTSYASVLAEAGRVDEAVLWLRRAMTSATVPFLEHLSRDLGGSPHAALRDVADEIRARLTPASA